MNGRVASASTGAGALLPALARAALCRALDAPVDAATAAAVAVDSAGAVGELERPGAAFVTLTRDGHLRGCIGSLVSRRPLREDVEANAVAAALYDRRFPPVREAELPLVRIEVSVLGEPEPRALHSEAAVLAALRPGRDGVLLSAPGRRATFLPQVWKHLPDPRSFLRELRIKAGLDPYVWDPAIRVATYEVETFAEGDSGGVDDTDGGNGEGGGTAAQG